MATECTLCFITKDRKVLLQKKAKGRFGELKWNGPGGKFAPNESAEACAVREVFEETGLTVSNLENRGILNFYNHGKKDSPEIIVHIFVTQHFSGSPKDLGEGQLRWFDFNTLPFDQMWEDDRFWLPHVLAGKKINAHFYFTGNFDKIFDYSLEVL